MTPEEKRIAIAEACGWVINNSPPYRGLAWHKTISKTKRTHDALEELPDYLNDLNAMHEAEKTLSRGQLHTYMLNMQDVKGLGGNNHWLNFHATAAQRADAFLMTIGKLK